MSRPLNPGEQPIHRAYRSADSFMSHTQRAVITDVNEANGTCSVSFESTQGERSGVTLPFYIHFGRKNQRRKTAWARTMPQPGDCVLIGFDSNSEARILGYDSVGYDLLSSIQEEEGKFGFRDLKMGEFDQKSSGGAYLKGDAVGNLFLAGGMASVNLDKKNFEIQVSSGRVKESLGTSTIRKGLVKRSPLPFMAEMPAKAGLGVLPFDKLGPAAAAGDLYEFTVDLRAAATPSSPLAQKVALFSFGNVLDPIFSVVGVGDAYGPQSTAGILKFKTNPAANARMLIRIYDSAPSVDTPIGTEGPFGGMPTRPFEWGVDQLGNSYMNVGAAALQGFNVWAPTQISLTSNLLHLSGMVFLGGQPVLTAPGAVPLMNSGTAAPQPVICGTLFGTALATFLTAVGTAAASCASAGGTPGAVTGFSTAVATACTALAGAYVGTLSKSVFCAPEPAAIPPVSQFQL